MKIDDMRLEAGKNQYGKPQLKVIYESDEGSEISEVWALSNKTQKQEFLKNSLIPIWLIVIAHFWIPHRLKLPITNIDCARLKLLLQENQDVFGQFEINYST